MYVLQEEELTQPIHFAAQHGKCDVVRGLITEYGIDPTSKAVVSYYQAYCMCGLHWFSVKMTSTANQSFFQFHRVDFNPFILLLKKVMLMSSNCL